MASDSPERNEILQMPECRQGMVPRLEEDAR
jgi:hypothetical protein